VAPFRALRVDAAPDADERVRVPLAPDGRLLAVAGVDRGLVGKTHEHVHDRAAKVVERVGRAADRACEERVAREAGLSVDDVGEHPLGVPGRPQSLDAEVSGLDDLPVPERLRSVDALLPRGDDAQSEALLELPVVGDVVPVRVCRQEVRDVHLEPVDRGEERRDRGARIDEDGRASGAVRNQVRVGEPLGIHAPFDDHGAGRMPAGTRIGRTYYMAGLMSRTSNVMKAWISKLLGKAEDPSVTLDYSYEKQLEMLQKVKKGVADVVTAKKRLELQTQKLEQEVPKLEQQARQALNAGREDLARGALERKAFAQQQLQGLDQQIAGLEDQQEKLVASEKRVSAKVEAFRSQKEVIKAQYSAAEAQVRIGEAATGIGEEMADTGLAIQRAQDKTEQMQARAAAVDELVEAGTLEDFTGGTQLDRELAALSAGSQVDADLARLKGELESGEGRKELEEEKR
jgi:phage shock protein A